MQDPKLVARGLSEIAGLLRFAGEPKFKIKAYQRAAELVDTLGDELAPLVEQGRLREVEGIGRALAQQIRELWNAGESEYLQRLRSEQPPGAAELIQVPNLTPKRIRALSTIGVHSVLELRAACQEQRVRALPGFGAKTEARLLASAERWLGEGTSAPRPVVLPRALGLATLFERELQQLTGQAHLAGALRRGEELVHELEFVVDGEPEQLLPRLARMRQVVRIEPATATAYLTEGLRLKLHPARSDLGGTLVRATGNSEHLSALAARAQARGFSLFDANASSFADEAALYSALGLNWIPPELRNGRDEVALATHDDFADLIRSEDVQGLVHCHTTYSDGKHSVLEMAATAHALGMKYITITDHSPSAHYAGGVTLDRLKQQWDEIAAAQEQVPIRILRGTESDILSDGALDFPDAILEQFDVVIASIHARHRLDHQAMTERLKRALSLPLFKIWGHALGRILNHRDPIACDVPAVLDALASSRGAVEINADPHRLDLPPAWLPAARERGLPFVISVDAHSTHGFGVLRYGVTMARRGGLRRQEVLNTLSAEEFAARVRPA